jgi:fructose-specific phosphotransferase system IIC component
MHWNSRYLDLRSAIFVAGGTLAIALIRCDVHEWRAALRVTVTATGSNDVEALHSARRWYSAAVKGAIISGGLGGLINPVGVLYNSHAPLPSHLNGIATSLLYPLYGIVLSQFALDPFRHAIESRINRMHTEV